MRRLVLLAMLSLPLACSSAATSVSVCDGKSGCLADAGSSGGSGSIDAGAVDAGSGDSVDAGGSTGSPPPCPPLGNAVPMNVQMYCGGTCQILLASGQVGYMRLPRASELDPSGTYKNFKVQFDESTFSPTSGVQEISINRCPGVIDTTGSLGDGFTNPSGAPVPSTCYARNENPNAVIALNFFSDPGADPAQADSMAWGERVCEAYDSFNQSAAGPLYVNVRWTYPGSCDFSPNGQCGFTGQFNVSGYDP